MIGHFSEHLESDLNWREAELASFKIAISSSEKSSVRERALLRGAWAILYSHYEGFCKFAWDSYLDQLEELRVSRSSLKDDIALLSLKKEFKKLRGDLSDSTLWDFIHNELPTLVSKVATFDEKLETESNLWPNIFKTNANALGINPKFIDKYWTKIRTLVSRRNEIAHGKKMVIGSIEEYIEYENATLLVMHDLAVCLIESLERKSYSKQS
jgi:hypothetical protein